MMIFLQILCYNIRSRSNVAGQFQRETPRGACVSANDPLVHVSPLLSQALGAFTYWSVRAGNRKSNRGLRLDYGLVVGSPLRRRGFEGHLAVGRLPPTMLWPRGTLPGGVTLALD